MSFSGTNKKNIKLLVMDVDGTLTDGHIYMGANGELMKAFDIKDGYAIVTLDKIGVTPVIITGRSSEIVAARAKDLKIKECYQGVSDKLSVLKEVAAKYGASAEEIAYIGDDVNDLDCIGYCGLTACPADAVKEVRQAVKYVCKANGGRGAVRELVDEVIKDI
jgi:3-deoxy-D-manno-octulosonate 8-phosphate phosphatase (KDO 8-P phosphatase)